MEQFIIIIELLSKVGFNFWQVFGFLVIMLFRKQIIGVLNRIVNIKFSKAEINLEKVVKEVKNIENQVLTLPDGDKLKDEISEGVQSLNREASIYALKKIRANTTFIWPTFVSALLNKQAETYGKTRGPSFLKIINDLELLKNFGLLEYKYEYTGTGKIGNYTVFKITFKIHEELFDLIKCINQEEN